MSTEPLSFEDVIIKLEKEDEDLQVEDYLEDADEYHDPLHDFPIDTEEIKVEKSEDLWSENFHLADDLIEQEIDICNVKIEIGDPQECNTEAGKDLIPQKPKRTLKKKWRGTRRQRVKAQFALRFVCDICPAKFYFNSQLLRHKLIHSDDKPYVCPICSHRSRYKDTLKKHMDTHAEKPYNCTRCASSYNHEYLLDRHVKVRHTPVKSYKCCICPNKNRFSSKAELKTHLRIHAKQKYFICEFCSWVFSKKFHLYIHKQKRHKNQTLITCDFCPKTFTKMTGFNTHLRMHTRDGPLQCDYCITRFQTQNTLTKHIEDVHEKKKSRKKTKK